MPSPGFYLWQSVHGEEGGWHSLCRGTSISTISQACALMQVGSQRHCSHRLLLQVTEVNKGWIVYLEFVILSVAPFWCVGWIPEISMHFDWGKMTFVHLPLCQYQSLMGDSWTGFLQKANCLCFGRDSLRISIP